MTMDEYVKWLENRIAVVGGELEVLLNARKSMEMARDAIAKVKPPSPKPKALAAPAKANPRTPDSKMQWQEVTANVLEVIRVALPERLATADVIRRYYPDRDYQTLTKREKDKIYAVLSYMKSQGTLERSAQGYWINPSAALTGEKTNG
jgi:hypothetical protein